MSQDDLEQAQRAFDEAIQAQNEASSALSAAGTAVSLARQRLEAEKRKSAAAIPVDRTQQQLVSGDPVPEDRSHIKVKENGQQTDYVVLSASERGKGFVRPYRDAYRNQKCGAITTMSRAIAETYARDPKFYSGTFCTTCRSHFPVGENGEFTWYEMDGREGPKVGT